MFAFTAACQYEQTDCGFSVRNLSGFLDIKCFQRISRICKWLSTEYVF